MYFSENFHPPKKKTLFWVWTFFFLLIFWVNSCSTVPVKIQEPGPMQMPAGHEQIFVGFLSLKL